MILIGEVLETKVDLFLRHWAALGFDETEDIAERHGLLPGGEKGFRYCIFEGFQPERLKSVYNWYIL